MITDEQQDRRDRLIWGWLVPIGAGLLLYGMILLMAFKGVPACG